MEHTIGKTIAELRKKQGWTQAQLAEKLHVTDKAVSKRESEAGTPEISILPVLANTFGVSLDYLMTGKQPEVQIITMSKMELCAKNDDVSMLSSISFDSRDEQKKTIFDHIVQYQSVKVFTELCEKYKPEINKFSGSDTLTLALLANNIDLLKGTQLTFVRLKFNFNSVDDFFKLMPRSCTYDPRNQLRVLPNEFFETLVTDTRITDDTLNLFLGKMPQRECVWYYSFPYLIHYAYINGKTEIYNKLLALSESNNIYAYKNLQPATPSTGYYGKNNSIPQLFYLGGNSMYGLVHVLKETIEAAISNEDITNLERLNEINSSIVENYGDKFKSQLFIADEHQIKMCRLKADNSITSAKLLEEECLYDGIIDVQKVLNTKDSKFISDMFKKYPITHWEILIELYNKRNYKAVYKIAFDKNMSLASQMIKHDGDENDIFHKAVYEALETDFNHCRGNRQTLNGLAIIQHDEKFFDGRNDKFWNHCDSLNSLTEQITESKQKLLNELKIQENYHKNTDGYTKEYFEELLQNGDIENVVIKLCIKLEGILREHSHLEGDLFTMLTEWCNMHGDKTESSRLLQKLRMSRNATVHPEKGEQKLTVNELKKCIDIVCQMV